MVASGVDGVQTIFSSSTVVHPHLTATPDPTPDILKIAFLAPLLANAGRMVAQQGIKGALKTGAKKVGEKATKEGLKEMAAQGAKKVMSQEGMEAGMSKLKERQQQKEMERRQKSNELMEQGRQRASTGSTTMGA